MWSILAIVGGLAIAAAALLTRQRKTTVDETGSYRAEVCPELAQFIYVVNHANSPDDAEFVATLEVLGKARKQVVADATRLLGNGSDAPFGVRHSVLLAVSALREPTALDLLSVVALNPQPLSPKEPDGLSVDLHGGGALVAVTILALDALEGIEALADDGFEPALDVLVQAAAVDSNAIRGFALTALGAKPERRAHRERAMAGLPRELDHLARLRRVPVEQVPQIADPRLHLAGLEQGGPSAPEIVGQGGKYEVEVSPAHGAPRVGRR